MEVTINMNFIKKSCIFLLLIMMLFACGIEKHDKSDNLNLKDRYEIIEKFFEEYDKKEYRRMEKYLTLEMKDEFSELVKTMPRARLIKIDKKNSTTWDNQYWINIDLEVELTKESALYPDEEWKIYILTEKINGKWKISDYTTG